MVGLALLTACRDPHAPPPVPPEPQGPCDPDVPGTLCTVAGSGDMGLSPPNEPALDTWLLQPILAAIDHAGRFVLADYNNYVIRRLDDDGILRTVVGNGAHGYAKVGA